MGLVEYLQIQDWNYVTKCYDQQRTVRYRIIIVMNVFRSRRVKQYGCLITTETAFETISQLLSLGDVEIHTDEHENNDSRFIKILLRIRALKVKLRNVLLRLEALNQEPIKRLDAKETKDYIGTKLSFISKQHQDFLLYLDDFEHRCETEMAKAEQIVENNRKLREKVDRASDELEAAKLKLEILGNHDLSLKMPDHVNIEMITGSIEKQYQHRLERMVFRISRGNSFCLFKKPKDNAGKDKDRVVFMIFVSGDVGSYIYKHIQKLLSSLDCDIFTLPQEEEDIQKHITMIDRNLKETRPLLELSEMRLKEQIDSYTSPINSPRIVQNLVQALYFERIAYILTHQQQQISGNHLIIKFYKAVGSGPLPGNLAVFDSNVASNKKTQMPRLECLDEVNQLVQMFAIPRNDEINPSIFMLITVPILFGMMFSDFGHGTLLFVSAYILNLSSFWKLMGAMSIYFGILFNEFFGMKVNWFYQASNQTFGLAPIWGKAENALAFENSLKMKLSMIAAFVHMVFGSFIRIANDIHQKKKANLILQSIPKLILLVATVGYLNFLIVFKWTIDWTGRESQAPSIINMYLDMFLGYKERKTSMFSSIDTEKRIAMVIKLISILCLLSIMIGTEVYKRYFERHAPHNEQHILVGEEGEKNYIQQSRVYEQRIREESKLDQDVSDEKIKAAEVAEMQSPRKKTAKKAAKKQEDEHMFGPLEGFEYVLSLISSTTSYLRLFALSLAHQKLSVLLLGFMLSSISSQSANSIILTFKSLVFFFITVGMMLLLDVLECMMHVIRLHWVEWMGRFYKGGGELFKPESPPILE